MSSIDQCGASETPLFRAPQTSCVSYRFPSDSKVTHVSCVNQDSLPAADRNSVFGGGFSGKQLLEPWAIPFGDVDVSEAPNCCASSDSDTPSQPSRSVGSQTFQCLWASQVNKFQFTVFSCIRLEKLVPPTIQSSQQNPIVSTKPWEILAEEPSELSTQMEERERGGIRSGHRTRRQS